MPEADWKLFRELRVLALERFCQRVLDEITRISTDSSRSAHERYSEAYGLIQERDVDLAWLFNDPSRSKALLQLAAICKGGLLNEEERELFSIPTQDAIRFFNNE
jgi:hypothetical protein